MARSIQGKNVLLVLALVNAINYIDRLLVYSLIPLIKAEFASSDFHLGLLGTVFMLAHSIFTIPFGILADRWSKRKLITFGLIFWCVFTFISGFAQRLLHLIITRALIGIGGATFDPASTPLISERFDKQYRGRALGTVKVGMWLGGIIGLILGGVLGSYIGWRNTFFFVALPGFLLAYFAWNISEEPSVRQPEKTKERIFDWNTLVIFIILAGIFANFSAGAFVVWIIEFIVRYEYFDLPSASIIVGGAAAASGSIGILVGGSLADRMFQRKKSGRIITVALGMTVSTPFILLGIYAPNPTVLVLAVAIGNFFIAWYHGPIIAALIDAVSPSAWGTMTGVYIFFIHVFGDMPAPAVVGYISDLSSLRLAMTIVVLGNVLCALCFFIAIKVCFKK